MKKLPELILSGKRVTPLIEGGKGIGVTDGHTAGAWAAANCIGTFSGVTPTRYDESGNILPEIITGKTRQERAQELVDLSIEGCLTQAKIATEIAGGKGRIHMNLLWEMGGCEKILRGVLEKANGLIHGVTCGAGMPFKLGEICASHGVYYYPIVSSDRAFRALWKRGYKNYGEFLGGVVYEDPWFAGGHIGLSNNDSPDVPDDPRPRIKAIRKEMNDCGLEDTPIVIAGGVWSLADWEDCIDNPEIGPVAFQLGSRPLLTKESPVVPLWKDKLMSLKKGDVKLQSYSPTGFHSSAIDNGFLQEMKDRATRDLPFADEPTDSCDTLFTPPKGKAFYLAASDVTKAEGFIADGYSTLMKTPDDTVLFTTAERAKEIKADQAACMGCLSQCRFSSWTQYNEKFNTGKRPDPRSFCIHKSLRDMRFGTDVDAGMMFAGSNAYRFAEDEDLKKGYIPSVADLVERLLSGR